ncbi:hypothetical protein AUJ17_05060 [Candidatus Micrarchaeota archaeon CG1_02_47_40]|nr:MAG: hypothetical protein AUJ17_05060 [Candidatus Micrarchaeota archaeon CG1_02_47_40]
MAGSKTKTVSIILPTRNEAGSIAKAMDACMAEFERAGYSPQIIIADDNSQDGTKEIINNYAKLHPNNIIPLHRSAPYGFGHSIREAIGKAEGFATVVMMADLSDKPSDAVKMVRKVDEGFDVVFSTRFSNGGKTNNYPLSKYLANRSFNNVLRMLFLLPYADTSNAFKAYCTSTIKSLPLKSAGFEITVELPMLALMKGAKACEIPVSWGNREAGAPKWRIGNAFVKYSMKLMELFLLNIRSKFGRFESSK